MPHGALVQEASLRDALIETRRLLNDSSNTTLFEATFEHTGALVRADILQCDPSGTHLIEVKSATTLKEYYYADCTIQAWVIERAGLPLNSVQLAHIDNDFVYPGDGDYRGLFKRVDLSSFVFDIARSDSNWIPHLIRQYQAILAADEPEVEMGDHCHDPFECPFQGYCTPPQPEYPVSILPRAGKVVEQLQDEGIGDLRDIPDGRLTNPIHERIRRATLKGEPEIVPGVPEQLIGLPYPRFYLDFETIQFAVPIWRGTRPYQQLPFQYSCHIEDYHGVVRHAEFLDTSGEPPMRPLVEHLLVTLGETGPVFMYSPFERRVLKEMATLYTDLQPRLNSVIERLVDLLPIVREHYYHPAMKGSWSIKSVLPTIAPDLSYDTLGAVRDGSAAQLAYLNLITKDAAMMEEGSHARFIADMKEYCKRDTLGMVRLASFLMQS